MKHTADFGKKKHLKGKDLKLHSADNFKNSVTNNIHQTAADGIEIGKVVMTPEEYIEKLKEVQRTLDSVKDDLDRAIQRMEKRLETGYEYLEQESRLAVLAGRETVKLVESTLLEVGTAKIEY